ncbi:serine/threonine protein kinase [Microbispora sp. RL4-1S]|uniref:non-specific serine/threonine protein kinase n=1 Tax=Microbispora oryzae TaxID=2806554 RepID=A0A940WFK4_9ACTN|nr:serine/threonine-protein kinase [Microbispora oryzae]MBP2704581.1 serine/threonine protein kinase [Microbispora oryzae]
MGTAEQLIVRRYRLVRALGHGSMGVVWEGRDTLLDRPVAVREVLLPPALTETRRLPLAQRVTRAARHAERLRHPNVTAVYDVAEEDGTPYVVMELVPSRSLDGIVASDGPLTPERAAAIARKVLAALVHAHTAGVRHGDVRPSNVLLAHDGRVLLTDFGLGALAADPAFAKPAAQRAPAHGEPVQASRGVAAFLAPERSDGGNVTVASDLWSFGATLFFAVTGRPPGGRPADDVPEPLRPLVTGLLARDPRKRLDADAADRALAAIEPPPAPPAPARGGGTRTRLVAGIAAAALVVGAVGGWAALRPKAGTAAATPPGPSSAGTGTGTGAGSGGGTGGGSGGATASSAATPQGPSPSPSPARRLKLTWHRAETGWRAAVPKGWTMETTDYTTRWLDPKGAARLTVEVTAQSGTDPLGALQEAEAMTRPTVDAYRKMRLRAVTTPAGAAADWEFTWTQRKASAESHLAKGAAYHQYRRVIATGTTTSVLTWTTDAAEWDRLRPTLVRAFALFTPPAS